MTASLEDTVLERLRDYVHSLQGYAPQDLYALIMPQLERPLVRVAMELAAGCQSTAASMLGIHRNTLRTRLKELGLEDEVKSSPPKKNGKAAAKRTARRKQRR